jgi:O-methyltransferase involved in polyketide biosynthesis
LEVQAGNALLHLLASRSAPGSRIIMTAPPTPAQRSISHDAAAAAAAAAAKSAAGEALGAAAAAAVTGADGDGWRVDEKGVRVYHTVLHHTTFEEPTETLAR